MKGEEVYDATNTGSRDFPVGVRLPDERPSQWQASDSPHGCWPGRRGSRLILDLPSAYEAMV
jgi:hypothetical protein